MTLEEIVQGTAAERRVDRLKANAKSARDRARQLKAQADAGEAQLKVRQGNDRLSQARLSTSAKTIKPYR